MCRHVGMSVNTINAKCTQSIMPVANITRLVCQSILSERHILNLFVHSAQLYRCQHILRIVPVPTLLSGFVTSNDCCLELLLIQPKCNVQSLLYGTGCQDQFFRGCHIWKYQNTQFHVHFKFSLCEEVG